jgi:hypothetical protein
VIRPGEPPNSTTFAHWRRLGWQRATARSDRRRRRVLLLKPGVHHCCPRLLRAQMPLQHWYFSAARPTLPTGLYETEPEPHMGNRCMECGRGKGLGGSSINGMLCYIRGTTGLRRLGKTTRLRTGLTCTACRISKRPRRGTSVPPIRDDGVTYTQEPVTTRCSMRRWRPGWRVTRVPDDLNGYQQEGFGPMDRTTTPQGRRSSTASVHSISLPTASCLLSSPTRSPTAFCFQAAGCGVIYLRAGMETCTLGVKFYSCSGAIAFAANPPTFGRRPHMFFRL